jgi:hypothetical protein
LNLANVFHTRTSKKNLRDAQHQQIILGVQKKMQRK